MKKIFLNIINKPKVAISISALAMSVVLFALYGKVGQIPMYEYATAQTADVSGDLLLNGAIKEAENINLSFPKTGRIQSVYVHSGQTVRMGATLASLQSEDALGALNQAKGSYEAAQANYKKVVNGATGPDIDVAKTAVLTAESNLSGSKLQQDTAVENARRTLYSTGLIAIASSGDVAASADAPIISGAYKGGEGQYRIRIDGPNFSVQGLENGGGPIGRAAPQPIGLNGLYIQFSKNFSLSSTYEWVVTIPNSQDANYVQNYNAYQTALSSREQVIKNAEASLVQASANLTAKQASARPEDIQTAEAQVVSTQGAYQIALGAYQNNLIVAPIDGVVTLVDITAGENAVQNKTAIGLASSGSFQIDTYVTGNDINRIIIGTPASVSFGEYKNLNIPAHVVAVDSGATVQGSRATYKVTFELSGSDTRIHAGLSGNIIVYGDSKQNVLSIPRSGLLTQNGVHTVMMKHDNTLISRVVTIGLIGSKDVEIISGLVSGDKIAIIDDTLIN